MKNNRILIVFPTSNGLGGAEKRFFALWCYLLSKDLNVFLVCDLKIFNQLMDTSEGKNFLRNLPNLRKNHISHTFNLKKKITTVFNHFQKEIVQKEDIIHFVMISPLKRFSNKTIFSCTFSGLGIFSFMGKVTQFSSVFFSSLTDVLDPKTFKMFQKIFFYKKNSITMTPNSFTNPEIFFPIEKENIITFCGRFSKEKQILDFIKAIPEINNKIIQNKNQKYKFYIIGTGPQKDEVMQILSTSEYININIQCFVSKEPNLILNKSKIFLSLQKHNNYPSKSLIEAISSGNGIVATNCGDTGLLAKSDFSELIPESFTSAELSTGIFKMIERYDADQSIPKKAHIFIRENFTIEKMGDYFIKLYKK